MAAVSGGGGGPRRRPDWLKGNPDSRPGSAEIVSYQPDEVVIRAKGDRNSMLFLADSYYPGWRATVDGREEEIFRADSLFRAVRVPAGEHAVRFSFEPASFYLGSRFPCSPCRPWGSSGRCCCSRPRLVGGELGGPSWISRWRKRASGRQD